jgi:hypothetical protein
MNDTDRIIVSIALITLFALVIWRFRIVPRLMAIHLGPKKALAEWEYRLEELLQEHARSCLHVAAVEVELFELIQRMPPTFVHPVLNGIRLGHSVEQALTKKAVELGLYPVEQPKEDAEVIALAATGTAPMEWRGGRLVPRRK